MMLIVISHDVD